ncbi:hypothetical protein SALWKB12_1079 [Snodgrassella communis]|nr:hypothetical protein SALWKB12_1079 [Snodgrassella communis]
MQVVYALACIAACARVDFSIHDWYFSNVTCMAIAVCVQQLNWFTYAHSMVMIG